MKIKNNVQKLRITPTANGVIVEQQPVHEGYATATLDSHVFTDFDEFTTFIEDLLIEPVVAVTFVDPPAQLTPRFKDCNAEGCTNESKWIERREPLPPETQYDADPKTYCNLHCELLSSTKAFEPLK